MRFAQSRRLAERTNPCGAAAVGECLRRVRQHLGDETVERSSRPATFADVAKGSAPRGARGESSSCTCLRSARSSGEADTPGR